MSKNLLSIVQTQSLADAQSVAILPTFGGSSMGLNTLTAARISTGSDVKVSHGVKHQLVEEDYVAKRDFDEEGFMPSYKMSGRANRKRKLPVTDARTFSEKAKFREERDAVAPASQICEFVEATTQPEAQDFGKHSTHDRGSKSSRALLSEFKKLRISDEFVKDTFEKSLWYAREFFMEKVSYRLLKKPTTNLTPYFVLWCRGKSFPSYERFVRESDKRVVPNPTKAPHIKVRRLILKGLARTCAGPFFDSIKFYLAGKTMDVAQGRFTKWLLRCTGLSDAMKDISDDIKSTATVEVNKLVSAANLASVSILQAQMAATTAVTAAQQTFRNEVAKVNTTITTSVTSAQQTFGAATSSANVKRIGNDLFSGFVDGIAAQFKGIVEPVITWCKKHSTSLVITTVVVITASVLYSYKDSVSDLIHVIFGPTVVDKIQQDVAQSFGVHLGFGSIAAWLADAAKKISNLKTVIDGIKFLWESLFDLVDYAWEKIYGMPLTSKGKAKKGLLEVIHTLTERLEQFDPSESASPEKDIKFVEAYRELLARSKVLTFDKTLHVSLQQLLSKHFSDYMNALSRMSLGKTRTIPLSVYIAGPPGSGKSTLVQPMIQSLHEGEENHGDYDPRWKYDWKAVNEYQDTYDNHFAILLDDVFQVTDPMTRMAEAMEIINMVNTAPFPVHTAAIEKKGKTFCTSKLVVMTSNDNKFQDLGITDVCALTRRLHVKIYTEDDFLETGVVDVEFLEGISSGRPYWALYYKVPLELLETMLKDAFIYYRENPVDNTVTLGNFKSKFLKKEPLRFGEELPPHGFTRGDRQPLPEDEIKSALRAEPKVFKARKVAPKTFTNRKWQEKPKKKAKEFKPPILPDGENEEFDEEAGEAGYFYEKKPDEAQGQCEVQVPLMHGFALLKLEDFPKEYAYWSSKEVWSSMRMCLSYMSHKGDPDRLSFDCEYVENMEAMRRSRRELLKWMKQNKVENCVKGKEEDYMMEYCFRLFLKYYPERVKFSEQAEEYYDKGLESTKTVGFPDEFLPKLVELSSWYSAYRNFSHKFWMVSVPKFLEDYNESIALQFGVGVAFYILLKAAIYAVKCAVSLVWGPNDKPIDDAQSEDKFISRVQKERAKAVRRAQGRKAQVKDVAQSFDALPENARADLAKVISGNLPYKVSYSTADGTEVQGGWILFVRGGMSVTTLHGFKRDKEGNFLPGKGVIQAQEEKLVFDPRIMQDEGRIFADVNKDLCWMIHTTFEGPDLRRLFRDRVSDPDNLVTALVDASNSMFSSYTTQVTSVGTHDYLNGSEVVTVKGAFIADGIPGAGGDCGRVFFEKGDTEINVVGIHVAGQRGRSIVVHITKNMVSDVLTYFQKTLHGSDKVYLFPLQEVDKAHGGMVKCKIGSYNGWPVVGEIGKTHYTPSKSSFTQSIFVDPHYGEPLLDVDTYPALLAPKGGVDPLKRYSENFVGKESKDYFPHMKDPKMWAGVFPKSSYGKKYQKLTFEDVVYNPRNFGLEPIDKTTSPGGRWSLIGVNRSQLLDVESPWHQKLRQEVSDIETCLDNGEIPCEFHILHPKDEPKNLQKVISGDTRFFLIGSLQMQIVFRMYFGWFLSQQQKWRREVDIQVGINPYSEDWDLFARLFEGKACSDADIKKWDVNFPRRIAVYMPYVASLIWDNIPFLKMQMLLVSVLHCRVLIGKFICILLLLPSGFLLTAWMNSLVNSVAHRCIGKELAITLTVGVFGDDSVVGWSEIGLDGIDVLALIVELRQKWYGWISTSADKTGSPTKKGILQCQFLKRGFVKDSNSLRYVAPLDEASIRKMLTWIKAKTEGEVVQKSVQNVSVALMEASLHTEEYFNKLTGIIVPRWKEIAPKTFLPYDYSTSRYDTLHLECRLLSQ